MKRTLSYLKYLWIFAGFYLGMAMFIVLISKYLQDQGMTATEISIILSASTIMTMVVQPVVGILQEKLGRKAVTAATLITMVGTGMAFAFSHSYIAMLILFSLTLGLMYACDPYMEKLATECPFPYAALRSWGTVGFAVGAQICGLVYEFVSPMCNYWLFAGIYLTTTLCIIFSKGVGEDEGRETEEKIADNPARGSILKGIIGNGLLWRYMLVLALFYTNVNLNISYLPLFHIANGISESGYGLILLFATLMELPVIFCARPIMKRFSNADLISVCFLLQIIQFSVYVFVPVAALRAASSVILRSSTTMLLVMVNIRVLSSIVEAKYLMAAMTLIYALPRNAISVIMQYVGGRLIDAVGYGGMYIMLIAIAVAGLVLGRLFKIPTSKGYGVTF